jgi:ribosome-associated toxin RatA of RatAB toxin-antitoxin module
MDTSISHRMPAPPEVVFGLAARVEDWPRILPHYRWVRVLEERGAERIVEMAARRYVIAEIAIPLRWVSIQRVNAADHSIEFLHIGGVTRGMYVKWTIDSDYSPESTLARIRHVFAPRWPVPDAVLRTIVGDYFVNGVAARTLRHMGDVAAASATQAQAVRPRRP